MSQRLILALTDPARLGRFAVYRVRLLLSLLLAAIYYPTARLLALFGVRFLVSRVVGAKFGHQAIEPVLYLQSGLVGGHPKYRAILLAPPSRVANPTLLDYWRDSFMVIDSRLLSWLLRPFEWLKCITYQTYPSDVVFLKEDGVLLKGGPAEDEILKRYANQYPDRPLLKLTDEHMQRGRAVLHELGMPLDAWWVTLHVREPGFYQRLDAHRDSDPTSYLSAAKAIADRGGWVVRIGDSSMSRLPEMDNVIDLAHSELSAGWMDIFLIGGGRFILGTNSGPVAVALAFGRPVAAANQIPMGHAFWPGSVYTPKLYQKENEDRFLTFIEVLTTERRNWMEDGQFHANGVGWRDNTDDEILDLTNEVLDRIDGRFEATQQDDELQKAYWCLFESNVGEASWGSNSKVAAGFLRKHQALLLEHSPD